MATWPRLHRIHDDELTGCIRMYSVWKQLIDCVRADGDVIWILSDVTDYINALIRIHRAALHRTGEYNGFDRDVELVNKRRRAFVHSVKCNDRNATVSMVVRFRSNWTFLAECDACRGDAAKTCRASVLARQLRQVANEVFDAMVSHCNDNVEYTEVLACVRGDTKYTERYISVAEMVYDMDTLTAELALLHRMRDATDASSVSSTADAQFKTRLESINDDIDDKQAELTELKESIRTIMRQLENIADMQTESKGDLCTHVFDNVIVVCGGTPYVVIDGNMLTLTLGKHSTTYDISYPGTCAWHRRLKVVVMSSMPKPTQSSRIVTSTLESVQDIDIRQSHSRWIDGDRDTMFVAGRFKAFTNCAFVCDENFFRVHLGNVAFGDKFVIRDSVLVENEGRIIAAYMSNNVKTHDDLLRLVKYAGANQDKKYEYLLTEMSERPFPNMYEIADAFLRGKFLRGKFLRGADLSSDASLRGLLKDAPACVCMLLRH